MAFIEVGGTVILNSNSGGAASNANAWMEQLSIEVFGSQTGPVLSTFSVATPTDPAAIPIVDGPFGVVSTFRNRHTGQIRAVGGASFEDVGAIRLAGTNPDDAVLALIPRGVHGAGQVLIITNFHVFVDPEDISGGLMDTPDSQTLLLNLIASACQLGVSDADGDGVDDDVDNCPDTANAAQLDTDGDMVDDNVDDLPTTPGVTSGFIEDDLRALCDFVKDLALENFDAPNNNARRGRRNAMCNKLNSAANKVAQGNFASAHDKLQSLLQKVDDENQPPDWMVHVGMEDPSNKDVVRDDVSLMIFLIGLEL